MTLKIKGDGPIGSIVSVANCEGEVKGYVDNPHADVPSRSDGKLDVGSLVGKNGQIALIRDYGLKEPFVGYAFSYRRDCRGSGELLIILNNSLRLLA